MKSSLQLISTFTGEGEKKKGADRAGKPHKEGGKATGCLPILREGEGKREIS